MKKVIALASLAMLPLSYAAAEGFQVNAPEWVMLVSP